ncbi:hypothetical protein ACH4ZX_18890 [Streptomyces sp. NPDC020490]|uniref:hypothetical protein n=1 Tax=Streptomyces sp. NPDC020490 TaxID=3365078 RepID=UPI0037981B73
MNFHELEEESAQLLPGREALGKLKFSLTRMTRVTAKTVDVAAHNESLAANDVSPFAVAQSEAAQSVCIRQ